MNGRNKYRKRTNIEKQIMQLIDQRRSAIDSNRLLVNILYL